MNGAYAGQGDKREPTNAEIQARHDAISKDTPNGFDSWDWELEEAHNHRGTLLTRLAAVGHLPEMWREDNSHNTDHADQLQEILENDFKDKATP